MAECQMKSRSQTLSSQEPCVPSSAGWPGRKPNRRSAECSPELVRPCHSRAGQPAGIASELTLYAGSTTSKVPEQPRPRQETYFISSNTARCSEPVRHTLDPELREIVRPLALVWPMGWLSGRPVWPNSIEGSDAGSWRGVQCLRHSPGVCRVWPQGVTIQCATVRKMASGRLPSPSGLGRSSTKTGNCRELPANPHTKAWGLSHGESVLHTNKLRAENFAGINRRLWLVGKVHAPRGKRDDEMNQKKKKKPPKKFTITQVHGRKVQAFLMLAAPAIYRCVEKKESGLAGMKMQQVGISAESFDGGKSIRPAQAFRTRCQQSSLSLSLRRSSSSWLTCRPRL